MPRPIHGLVALLLLVGAHSLRAQSVDDIMDRYRYLDPALIRSTNPACADAIEPLWKTLQTLRAHAHSQRQLQGRVTGGFNGDVSGERDRYEFKTGISFSQGSYPGEVEFSSNVSVILEDGVFREDVSTLSLSYDYNAHPLVENYVFANRYTDNYMGIDQRYEVGGGTILGRYDLLGVTGGGKAAQGRLYAYSRRQVREDGTPGRHEFPTAFQDSLWYACVVDARSPLNHRDSLALEAATQSDMNAIRSAWENARETTRKRYGRLRAALLFGLFADLEKATVKTRERVPVAGSTDSTTTLARDISLPGSQAFRWEVRPTLDIRPSDTWRLSFRPYVKLPMPWAWTKRAADGQRKLDYRLDLNARLSVRVAELGQDAQLGVQFTYEYLFDNVPPWITPEVRDNRIFETLEAEPSHHIFDLTFSVSWGG